MNDGVTYVDINQICRLCLRQTEVSPFFLLVTKHNLTNQNISFVEMLESHVQFKISEGDNKPQNVCSPCLSQLFISYHFFEMCALSNNVLDEALRHNNPKELETIDLTDDTEKENDNEYKHKIDHKDDDVGHVLKYETNENLYLFSINDQEEIIIDIESDKVSHTLICEEHNYSLDCSIRTVNDVKKNIKSVDKRVKTEKIELEEKPKQRKTISRKSISDFKMSRKVKLSQFNCLICKETFATFKDVIDHFDKIHEGCTRCILCDKLLRNAPTKLLKYHMNRHRRKNTRFDCKKCHQYFLTRTEMEEHYESKEHNRDPKVCKICNRAYQNIKSLRVHMLSHTTEKKNQCSKCGKCFKYSCGLTRHFRVIHKGVRLLCNICGNVFTTKVGLDKHIQAVHEGNKSFYLRYLEWKRKRLERLGNKQQKPKAKDKVDDDSNLKNCRFCAEVLRSVSGRKRHEAFMHGSEQHEFKCHRCLQVFPSSKARLAHLENVHYKHKCPYCDRGFSLEIMFKRHVALHKKPGYTKCIQCNQECKTQTSLKIHMTTHTGDRPYKCDECDKAFRQLAHLRYHQFMHTRKKPYECHLCRKTFGQDSYLQSHLNVHKGERPFVCDLCDKAYTEKGTLTKHIKKTHRGHVETLRKPKESANKEHKESLAKPDPSVIVIEMSPFSLDIENLER